MSERRLDPSRLPEWPRLLGIDLAAAYCGISPHTFEARCTVKPVQIGARKLWDRKALDRWVDGLGRNGDAGYDPDDIVEGRAHGDQSARH